MSLDTLQSELARLDERYREVCALFADGEITADDARTRVLALRHVDDDGRVWRIDTKKSGRSATFTCASADPTVSFETSVPNITQPSNTDPGLTRLDDDYRAICAAFDAGDITADDARTRVLALRHVDDDGRVWRIDTKKSGRSATFTCASADPTVSFETSVPNITQPSNTDPGLTRLDDDYRAICAAFDAGDITADDARTRVLALRHVDDDGRVWRVDTKKSGRHARFRLEGTEALSRPVVHHPPSPGERRAASLPSVDPEPSASPRPAVAPRRGPVVRSTRRTPTTGLARPTITSVAAAVALVALIIVAAFVLLGGGSDDAIDEVTGVDPTPSTSVDVQGQVVPQLATVGSFGSREAVPFDQDLEFGRSVRDQSLVVHRRGIAGAPRVLLVGSIHGDELAGIKVTRILREMALDVDVDLWLVDNMNPDGSDDGTRQNANGIDMNRNFPTKWERLGEPGYWQYAGESPASEPEVRAMMRLGELVQPDFTIFYHQDYFRIAPTTGRDGRIRARYAELVNLPLKPIQGGTYTGTANQWGRTVNTDRGLTFVVEFGPSLADADAQKNADAVLTIVREFFATP